MSETKKPPKLVLSSEQKEIVEQIRRQVEKEKPEMIAEGRRVFAAEEFVSVRLHAAISLLKAVRKAQGITLDEVAKRTGMSKPSLSRLENDAEANVTISTLYRIADALGHDLQISVVPQMQSAPKKQRASAAGSAIAKTN